MNIGIARYRHHSIDVISLSVKLDLSLTGGRSGEGFYQHWTHLVEFQSRVGYDWNGHNHTSLLGTVLMTTNKSLSSRRLISDR